MPRITLLHTSDWHLGHMLYKKRRDGEFAAFLAWLESAIREYDVDALLIAGDIFDTPMPGTGAQKMYYDFLGRAARAGARHVVITAGNHDSPTFLTAPAGLLRSFNIHVVGAAPENPEDEIRVLRNAEGQAELIVCAVPYLRERDLRASAPGESSEEKDARLLLGLRQHYSKIAEAAAKLRAEAGENVPVIGMGHLFAAGSETSDGDGTRELYVGNLGRVPVDIFGETFDYVALGHIHKPQCVGGQATRRYSGSPLHMGFGEKDTQKSVVIAQFSGSRPELQLLSMPRLRHLERVCGNRASILAKMNELKWRKPEVGNEIWVEVRHDGSEAPLDLNERVQELAEGTALEVLCVKQGAAGGRQDAWEDERGLEELGAEDIFTRLMAAQNVPEDKRGECLSAFRELLADYAHSGY